MTEQEVEALAKRLERVWHLSQIQWQNSMVSGQVTSEVQLRYSWQVRIELGRLQNKRINGWLVCTIDSGKIETNLNFFPPSWGLGVEYAQFANEWMPFFRRNCWLSGCPLEASVHEKAEWIQGFTREEIEAWNLKM